MLKSEVGRLRLVGILEGVSFLLLLGVAMPLKYLAGMPMAVRVVGMAHGVLFILYLCALADAALTKKWGLRRVGLLAAASLVPFGPLLADRGLREEAAAPTAR